MQKRTLVTLPTPPTQWDALSGKQIEHIHHIARECAKSGKDMWEYRLRCFLYLNQLKVLKEDAQKDDGTVVYFVRRKGFWHWLKRERLAITTEEVWMWCKDLLSFLDDPFNLPASPYEIISVDGVYFKAPDAMLTSVSYEQYNNVQRSSVEYWSAEKEAEELLGRIEKSKDGKESKEDYLKEVRECHSRMTEAKSAFLSHLLVPATKRRMWNIRWKWMPLVLLPVTWPWTIRRMFDIQVYYDAHPYSSIVAERLGKYMRKVSDDVFDVFIQQVQTALVYYRASFPLLFTESDGENGKKDELISELDTINAIMVEQHYIKQQDVYDTNAVLIFSVLSRMIEKAKAIDAANARMKVKK